jgi:hypothetical protein
MAHRLLPLRAVRALTYRAQHDDKKFVDHRDKPRFPADMEVWVTDLGAGTEAFSGKVIDISESGVCASLPRHLIAGSLVKLDLDDAVLYGHVSYAFGTDVTFRTGISVESVLLGTSGLSNILQSLLDAEPLPTPR